MDTLMLVNEEDGQKVAKMAKKWTKGTKVQALVADKGDAARGYQNMLGSTDNIQNIVFQGTHDKLVICQEFGTINSLLVFRALVYENAAYWYGNKEDKRRASVTVRNAFYIRKNSWKNEIVERGKYLYYKSL